MVELLTAYFHVRAYSIPYKVQYSVHSNFHQKMHFEQNVRMPTLRICQVVNCSLTTNLISFPCNIPCDSCSAHTTN